MSASSSSHAPLPPYRTGPQDPNDVQLFEPQPLPPAYALPPIPPRDEGEMMWFGRPWGARANRIYPHVPTPSGVACAHCSRPIQPQDHGYCLLHTATDPQSGQPLYQRYVLHRICFVQACLMAGIV